MSDLPQASNSKENIFPQSSPGEVRAGLAGFAIRNPHFIIVACLFIAIFGILSIIRLPKDLLPAANLPAVQILTFYPGMPVRDTEEDLSARFERYTGQAIGISRQTSRSILGVSIVKDYFNEKADLNTAITQVTSTVLSVLRRLPPGTQPPLILPFDPMASTPLALVAVSGDLPATTLYDRARYEVRNAIQAVPGAMAPTVMGGAMREAVAYLDPNKLDDFNLTPVNVIDHLNRLNTFVPAGDVKLGDYDLQILSNGIPRKIDEMNEFPLRAQNGALVRLSQVGQAKDSSAIQTNVVLINGKEQVYVPVFRQPGANSIRVVEQVRSAIARLARRMQGVHLTLVGDQSVFVKRAVKSIAQEAAAGGGLALLMVLLFLGSFRAAGGVFLCLCMAFLLPFLGLSATDQTINAMTLGGLALSIGVLVDNSIVVVENISSHLERNASPSEAALAGAREVAMPVLASTLATLAALFPAFLLTGIVEILFSAVATMVAFSVAGSYFVAMTVMPLYASHALKESPTAQKSKLFRFPLHALARLTQAYAATLQWALDRSKVVLACGFGLLLAGGILAPFMGAELFPRADSGALILMLRLPTGTRIEKTVQFSRELDQRLRHWIDPGDLKMIITNAGVYYGYPAAFTPNTGTQDVFFDIELTPKRAHTSQFYAATIREKIKELYPDVDVGIQLGGLLSSAINYGRRAPIDVEIQGDDVSVSRKIAEGLLPAIRRLKGAVDARIQQRLDAPAIFIRIDRRRAADLGLTPDDVVKNVVSAVSGSASYNPAIWVDPKTGIDYFLAVQFPQRNFRTLDDVRRIPIRSSSQARSIPLGKIAEVRQTTAASEADHVDLLPVADIFLDVQGRDIASLAGDVQKIVNSASLPPGYRISIHGEISEMKRSIRSLAGGFLLATLLVYLILVVQFRSYLLPLLILVAIPTGMSGIVFMLLATGTYFSIQSAIGAIFMIGIAVANGVLLIEFIERHVKTGLPVNEAVIRGARARLRPIMMTALASVLGLVPMAVGFGKGSEANIPLGRAVIGGELVSTALTLFLVPILYKVAAARSRRGAAR